MTDPIAAAPTITVRILGRDEAHVLDRVAVDVFDNPVDPRWCAAFFADPRHHLAVALDGELVVGMASGVDYVHPDKAPQFWVNEVGVATAWRNRGIAKRLMRTLLAHARAIGCVEGWVGTENENVTARQLYASLRGEEGRFILYEFDLTKF